LPHESRHRVLISTPPRSTCLPYTTLFRSDETDRFVTGMRIRKNGDELNYERFRFENRQSSADKYLMYPIDQDEVNKIRGLTGEKDRKSTRLNSSHVKISYAAFCLKKKKKT